MLEKIFHVTSCPKAPDLSVVIVNYRSKAPMLRLRIPSIFHFVLFSPITGMNISRWKDILT